MDHPARLDSISFSQPRQKAACSAKNRFFLIYEADENGFIEGETHQTLSRGGDGKPVFARSHEGYEFIGWSDGRMDNPRTDSNVTADVRVKAAFRLKTYILEIEASVGGVIWPSPDVSYVLEHGKGMDFQLLAADGFYLADDGIVVLPDGGKAEIKLHGNKLFVHHIADDITVFVRFAPVIVNEHGLRVEHDSLCPGEWRYYHATDQIGPDYLINWEVIRDGEPESSLIHGPDNQHMVWLSSPGLGSYSLTLRVQLPHSGRADAIETIPVVIDGHDYGEAVIRKKGDHILLIESASEAWSHDGYQWGWILKPSFEQQLQDQHGEGHFCYFDEKIDTDGRYYWVDIRHEGQHCLRRSFFNAPQTVSKDVDLVTWDADFLEVYPVPLLNNTLTVTWPRTKSHKQELAVYNMSGLRVFYSKPEIGPADNLIQIDMDHLPTGIYSVVLRTGGTVYQKRVILLNDW